FHTLSSTSLLLFLFNATSTTNIYTLSLHDALPISLQQCGETFYGYYSNGWLCGVVSIKTAKCVIDIHRLMVHPNHFRKGIAKKLLNFVEGNKEKFKTIIVST